jgi:hypothetical protein
MKRTCPTHDGAPLYGGPVHFTCVRGHGVPAADLSHEFTPRPTASVGAATSGGGR